MNLFEEFFQFINDVNILNSGRNLIFLLIIHFSNNISEIFSRPRFRQSWNNVTNLKAGDWTNFLPDDFDNFLLNLLMINILSSLNSNKSDRYLALDLIINPNDNGLGNLFVLHNSLLHLACAESMPSCIYNIINP